MQIIQGIDRKMPLDDLAKSNQLSLDELLTEMEAIVESGTKLNIDYYNEEAIDEGTRDEIYDYFMEAETDLLKPAIKSLQEEDITEEEIRIFRIKENRMHKFTSAKKLARRFSFIFNQYFNFITY